MWTLPQIDPDLHSVMENEKKRQEQTLSFIASENYASFNTMELQGSVLTNKAIEGYPGKRYHSGCEYVDIIENLAIDRANTLYNSEHANVQPHSGVNANLAVFASVLNIGDKILSMDLSHGGHLSHGAAVSFTGSQLYNAEYYGVDKETECLNYEEIRNKALKFKPKMIIAGCSSYSKKIDFSIFKDIADEVGAYLFADIAHFAGLIAAGLYPSPIPYADFVSGTLFKTLRGGQGGFILCKSKYAKKINYAVFPGTQGSANVPNIAAKAFCFKIASNETFKKYSEDTIKNAKVLAEALTAEGCRIVADGTDCHMFLVDVSPLGITGSEAENALEKAGILVNKNLIPFDNLSAKKTSGIRIGTSAVTARGLKTKDMKEVASLLGKILQNPKDQIIDQAKDDVKKICAYHPLYQDLWENN